MKRFASLTLVILCLFIVNRGGFALAQEKAEEAVNTGQDFTKPLTQFDISLKYQNLQEDFETTVITARVDKPFLLGNDWQLALRADLPYMWSDVPSADNPPPGENQEGFSDFLVQALFITPTKGKWTAGFGTQVIFPTAEKDSMGTGKYQLLPTLGVKYDLGETGWMKGAWAATLLRYAVDIGGDDDRPNINQTYIQPVLYITLPRLWFLTFAPEMIYDWRTENWHVPFDLLVGKMLTRKIVVTVEYKAAIVDDLPLYTQEVEFGIGFFF
ncbi:MAG TPA: hypothetical protein ACFYD6_15065 [Candidatus Brocadiia bacterium]|nr:hypothetical protein [Candidatus Brocadiales bacterium]